MDGRCVQIFWMSIFAVVNIWDAFSWSHVPLATNTMCVGMTHVSWTSGVAITVTTTVKADISLTTVRGDGPLPTIAWRKLGSSLCRTLKEYCFKWWIKTVVQQNKLNLTQNVTWPKTSTNSCKKFVMPQ